jgi:hypothetical protein
MATATTHSHGAHSHSHAHHHDNSYLTSQNKNDAGVRITRIGLYSNLGMAIAKGVGGYMFNSHAVSPCPAGPRAFLQLRLPNALEGVDFG